MNYQYGGTLEKQKEMMRIFVIFLFILAQMKIRYLSEWIASPPIILLIEIFFERIKMEKADKEKFMNEIWKKYNATKDVEFLAKACEKAPFFGQKEMALEIARILRLVKKN